MRRARAVALIGFIAIVVAIVFVNAEEDLFSDANSPHDTTAYDKLHAPPVAAPTLDSSALTNVTVIRTNNRVRVKFPHIIAGKADFYDYTTVRVAPGGSFKLIQGDLRIRYSGVAYGVVAQGDNNRRVEGSFFDLDGQPLKPDDIKTIHSARDVSQLSIKGQWPVVRLAIEAHPDEKIKFLSARLYDARTKRNLVTGHISRTAKPNFKVYDFEMKRWHNGPVELVLDVAYGPIETIEMKAQPSTFARVGHYNLHLLAMSSGHANSSGGGPGQDESFMHWTIQDKGKDTQATFGFAVFPFAGSFPAKVEFLVKGKVKLQSSGGHTSATGWILGVNSPLEDVQGILITDYPNARRIVFEIPRIPG